MEKFQSEEMKLEKSMPTVTTTSDFQLDLKSRTRFNLETKKHPPKFSAPASLTHEAKHDQPGFWFCGCTSDTNDTGVSAISRQRHQQEKYSKNSHVRSGKGSPSNRNASLVFADEMDEIQDHGYSDDMSGVVSRDVSTFTSKTVLADNRGKKYDLLQPFYDRMGLYSKKEKKGLRDALADLLFIMR